MSSDGEREIHAGGLVTGPAGEDSIPVRLMAGEHVYGPDGKLLFVVGGEADGPREPAPDMDG